MAEEPDGARVAYDGDGDPWFELAGERGTFQQGGTTGDGDQLSLSQIAHAYGLTRVVTLAEERERDLLLWLHAEAVWKLDGLRMYERTYFEVQKVLDEALGTEEEDGAGEGIAGDVRLLATRRDEAESSRQAWAEEAMRLDVEVAQLRDELREEKVWRDDLMREMSGLDPDRPIAKTSRRYQRERDEALDEVARLRKQVSCSCPSEPNPDPTGAVLPCGHRAPRSTAVSSSVLPDGEAQ